MILVFLLSFLNYFYIFINYFYKKLFLIDYNQSFFFFLQMWNNFLEIIKEIATRNNLVNLAVINIERI